MLHILLTTIISYNTNIHDVNRAYHSTFVYREKTQFTPMALYSCSSGRVMYNWRHKKNSCIYNKYEVSISSLPTNY